MAAALTTGRRGADGHPTHSVDKALLLPVLLLATLAVLGGGVQGEIYPEPGPDIAGRQYCAIRPVEQCCPGRDDYCTMPILDTVCYCDTFCNRTVSDCCPDFWGFCMGIDPPFGAQTAPPPSVTNNCFYEGKIYQPEDMVKPNCNNCTCVMVPAQNEYNWKCTQKICLIREELMDMVNDGNFGWTAANYSMFWGRTLEDGVRYRLGTFRPVDAVKQMTSLRLREGERLPDEFDARQQWPGMIHPVMDQGDCGASWAFSTVTVAADRLTLHSNGALDDMLSPQHLLSCDTDLLQKGCEGGHLDRAWWHMRHVGVVSDECYPYNSGQTHEKGVCKLNKYFLPPVGVPCPSGRPATSRVYQATPPYRIAPSEAEIRKEILTNGPVQATMEVKEDFYMYKGGVYRDSMPADTGSPNTRASGFHSVRIVGWGIDFTGDYPIKYWICANSWGENWGENGYFRIRRGSDEGKIESFVIGIWGKVGGRQIINRGQSGLGTAKRRRRRHHGDHRRHREQTGS